MTLCLFECLKAVGLQQHYDRFNSAGVCRAAHLSGLTMEDYPILGIRSMEERTRLFHLVQMAKTLDLESFEYEDDDYNSDGCTDVSAAVDSSSTYGCGASDEDVFGNEDVMCAAVSKLNAASFSKPSCVRRRLDFSDEVINHHQKPEGPVHVYGGHKRNFKVGQDHDESAIPVQLDPKIASVVVCSCRGNDNHGLDVHGLARVNTKSETMERNFMYTSHTRLSPKCVSSNKPKPRPAAVVSKRFLSNKVTECKDRKGISGRETNSNVVSEHMAKAAPVYESKRTAGYNYGLPLSSPPHPNKKQPGDQRISVCVRKRPLTRAECRRGEADVVTTLNGECLVVHESKEAVDLTQYILQHRFYFDQVFGEGSSNEEVYRRTAYPLVQHMLNGGKATCFAYGQTGAGKTHTMLGLSPERPGLYALAVQDIFAHLHTSHAHSPLLVYVSFFEIYCGQLYDLLDHRKRLFAREDGQNVVHIAGLRDVRVDSVGSLLEVISEGTEERTQGMSGANPLSSRSHALLQIQLRSPNQQLAGRMWFVDLAGSERASDTREPDRQSRLEGAEINQSLLALKECIRSLDQEQSHTPFRQSKLTQVLKDSFVGDSMTCMIANISPGHSATEHTLNTLRYADRVKELRGQGGLRGERRGKTAPSPKCNLSNSNNSSSGSSSVCTRGKSPPKKPKLGRQREAFGPATPDARSTTRGTILCSTPKKGSLREETSTRVRKEIGLEQTTPIRGSLGIAVKRERREKAVGRDGRGAADSADHSSGEQHRKDEELHLQDVQRESGFYHREKETQQSTLIGGIEAERWIEQRQLESSRDMYSEVEMRKKKDVQKVNEGEKERERHLRRYHQQLQQFMPSPASSSDHLFPSSTSLSSSTRVSLSSSVSPSSHRHSSSLIHHGLEDILDAYRARAELRGQLFSNPSEKICLQTGISPSYNRNKGQVHHCDLGGIGEDWSLSLEGTEAEFGQERGRSEKRRSLKATGEAYVRVGQNWRPAGMDRGGERRWAWMASTEQTDRTTGARPAGLEALASYNCDSEVGEELLDASDVPADGVEEQEEADSYALVSSNSLFNQPHQRAPAERPLSPACEPDNTLLTPNKRSHLSVQSKHTTCTSNILPLQRIKAQQGVPSSSRREKEPQFAADASGSAQSATLPLTQNGCKVSDNPSYTQVKAKMSLIAQGETSTDSVSYSMDPLSISLLQVDQQVATASFLRGEQNNTHPLENESGENKGREAQKDRRDVAEDKNVEFHLSLLEIPNAKTNCPPTSDTVTAANHSEQSNDMCFAIYGHCGVGMMKPPIPEVTLVSLQQHECSQRTPTTPLIKAPESSTKPSTSSIQFSGNTGSPSSRNLMTNGATQMPPENGCSVHNKLALSISTAQSDSVLGQLKTSPKQSSNHSNGSHKPVSPTGSKEEEKRTSDLQNKPIVHLSMLEDLYHDQWRVVQAHWEQLEEMETLCHKDGRLLCQQPDMAFKEYVHKLREIMEKKARCVHSMIVQLQPYLTISQSDHLYNQGEDRDNQIT